MVSFRGSGVINRPAELTRWTHMHELYEAGVSVFD